MSFLNLCEEYFNTRDLFELLKIERTATDKDVRKAYHKLSLLCHPDRVDESEKDVATEKFKILGRVHSILSNPERRALYLETGVYSPDEEEDINFEDADWEQYWRTLFRKITINDIKNYEQKYKGSEEERKDIQKAYEQSKGDMDKIYEFVPFLSLNEEDRVRGIITEMIDSKELPAYDIYINEPQTKRDRRIRKLRKEEKEADKMGSPLKEIDRKNDMDILSSAIRERRQARSENFLSALEQKYASSSGKKKGGRKSKP